MCSLKLNRNNKKRHILVLELAASLVVVVVVDVGVISGFWGTGVGLITVIVGVVTFSSHGSLPVIFANVSTSIVTLRLLNSGSLQQISFAQKHFESSGPRSILRFFRLLPTFLIFIKVAPFVIISPAKQA